MALRKRLWFVLAGFAVATSIVGCASMDDFYGETVATIDGVEVRERGDEFTGNTQYSVTVVDNKISGPPNGSISYFYSIEQDVFFGEYWRYGTDWLFPETVLWLADGESFETPILSVKDEVHTGGGVTERMSFGLTRSQLERIASSERAAISVRGDQYKEEWELEPEHRSAIRALLTHVDSL